MPPRRTSKRLASALQVSSAKKGKLPVDTSPAQVLESPSPLQAFMADPSFSSPEFEEFPERDPIKYEEAISPSRVYENLPASSSMPCWHPYGCDLDENSFGQLLRNHGIKASLRDPRVNGSLSLDSSNSVSRFKDMVHFEDWWSMYKVATKDLEEQLDFHEARVSFSIWFLLTHGILPTLIFLLLISFSELGLSQGDTVKR